MALAARSSGREDLGGFISPASLMDALVQEARRLGLSRAVASAARRRGMGPVRVIELLELWSRRHWYPPEDLHELEEEVLL